MVTACRPKLETQVSQERHEFGKRDVLLRSSREYLDEELRSRRHKATIPWAQGRPRTRRRVRRRSSSSFRCLPPSVGYSSSAAVRLISRNGGPNHFRTWPHIQHEHIFKLSALCFAHVSAYRDGMRNNRGTRSAHATARSRWARRSARRFRKCSTGSGFSSFISR
jgi:hypothetical protein